MFVNYQTAFNRGAFQLYPKTRDFPRYLQGIQFSEIMQNT